MNLRVFRKQNRLFLVAMLLSQCVAVWILLFGIAAIQNTLAVEREIDEMARYFDVYLLDDTTEGELSYDHALPLSDMLKACDAVLQEADYIETESIWITARCGEDRISIVYQSDDSPLLQSQEPLIQVGTAGFSGKKAGDSVTYAGRDYIIESVQENLYGKLSVAARFAPEDSLCYELQISLSKSPTTEEAEAFSDLLGQYFQYSGLFVPETVDPLTAQFHASTLTMCGVMMLAVVLNLCYAQMFIFQQRKRTFAVYRLCGAGKSAVRNLCIAETEILAIVCCLVAVLLFHGVFRQIVTLWYPIAEGMYTLRFYLVFGLSYLLFFLLLLALPLERLVRNDVIAVEREGSV